MEQNKKISKEILDLIASNFLTDKDSQFELTDIKKIFSDGLTESDEEISKKEETARVCFGTFHKRSAPEKCKKKKRWRVRDVCFRRVEIWDRWVQCDPDG